MTTLVLGASGLVGSNVVARVADRGGESVVATHSATEIERHPTVTLDIRDESAIVDVVEEYRPEHLVNCAAVTDVDGCEGEPERAHAVNARAPGTIANLCADRGIDFTHLSTDYVFDGSAKTPYDENADPNPVQEYGRTKLAGERAVGENHPDPRILRLSFVYGIHRFRSELEGFPAWVRGRLEEDVTTPLFSDQWVTPTRAGNAAETILDLHEREISGLFHVAARSCVTPYEFGTLIADRMDAPRNSLEEGSRHDVERDAERPEYSCLDVERLEEGIERLQPTLEEDLDAIGEQFY